MKTDENNLHYSGSNSQRFWDLIWSIPEPQRSILYDLGCELQNLELKMWKELDKR